MNTFYGIKKNFNCNNPVIFQQYILKIHDVFFFFKNFSWVSSNLAYPKLSTKSTSVPNQPFPQFNILIIPQHILINNITLSLTYQLNE
jgi:hypothetical protein